jgi:hypothetical protein
VRRVFVQRLVLVPEERQGNHGHMQ